MWSLLSFPVYLVFFVYLIGRLRIKHKDLHMLGKYSTTEYISSFKSHLYSLDSEGLTSQVKLFTV